MYLDFLISCYEIEDGVEAFFIFPLARISAISKWSFYRLLMPYILVFYAIDLSSFGLGAKSWISLCNYSFFFISTFGTKLFLTIVAY